MAALFSTSPALVVLFIFAILNFMSFCIDYSAVSTVFLPIYLSILQKSPPFVVLLKGLACLYFTVMVFSQEQGVNNGIGLLERSDYHHPTSTEQQLQVKMLVEADI